MKGYLVTVEGDYFGTATEFDRKRQKYNYKVKVKVPSPDGALSLIKNKLLDIVLRRQYPNYHMWRTHQLVSITNLDGSKVQGITNIRLMDFDDLANYVKVNRLPVKLEYYTDLGYLRTMVYLAETNQHEFRIKQARLAKDCEEDKKLRELNPDLYSTEPDSTDSTDSVHKTTILQGESEEIKATKTHNAAEIPMSANSPSLMITESKPAVQKVEKRYVEGEGFVNPAESDDFVEDFTKEDEKEFETYDPTTMASVEDL